MNDERFVSAVVLAPFALEGFVKARSLSGETRHLLRLSSVVLRNGTVERVYKIEAARAIEGAPSHILVKFKDIDTPEAAKALSGAEFLLSRSEAAPLAKGEYYIRDLKGLSVVDGDGGGLGEVRDIMEGGGGQLVEVRLFSGETRLVPFRDEFFGEINVEKREITLLVRWILE
ncbi:MAG: ribosome maturation factor RimM [Spirochaetaceae bacterium]|nr:ribosome maturation factor RimM [Spirochaetaceae bacterium]